MNPAETFQCIDGNFDSDELYGFGLLSPSSAENTPQFLLVKGKITFTDHYEFAPGSEIVFLDNNSGFVVDNNVRFALTGGTLHGCEKLWHGVEVLSYGVLFANDNTFEDAKAALILRNASVVEATGNTFNKNACGILAAQNDPNI